jgi:hypothetical protein
LITFDEDRLLFFRELGFTFSKLWFFGSIFNELVVEKLHLFFNIILGLDFIEPDDEFWADKSHLVVLSLKVSISGHHALHFDKIAPAVSASDSSSICTSCYFNCSFVFPLINNFDSFNIK